MARDLLSAAPLARHLVWRLLRILARDLPAGGAHLLAHVAADVVWFVDGRGRRTVDDNLRPLVPDQEARRRTGRAGYRACATQLIAALRRDRRPRRDPRTVAIRDPWGVFATRPRRGPLVLAGSHAEWDLLLDAIHAQGLVDDLAVVALPAGDAWIDGELARLRGLSGARTLPWSGGARAALAHLRAGRTIGLLADRDYTPPEATTGRLLVRVAGRTLALPTGPVELARRSGATVIPLALVAGTMLVGRPLHPTTADDVTPTVRAIARFHLRALAAAPGRWVAFHRVWK